MYCTVQDVKYALAPSDPTDNTPVASTDAAYADAIEAAGSVIDTYILSRYQIVVDVEVEITVETTTIVYMVAHSPIRFWTRDIAAYYLWLTYNRGRNLEDTDPIRLRYDAVMATLKLVASGTLSLLLPVYTTVDPVSDYQAVNLYEGHLFDQTDFSLDPTGRNSYGGYNG